MRSRADDGGRAIVRGFTRAGKTAGWGARRAAAAGTGTQSDRYAGGGIGRSGFGGSSSAGGLGIRGGAGSFGVARRHQGARGPARASARLARADVGALAMGHGRWGWQRPPTGPAVPRSSGLSLVMWRGVDELSQPVDLPDRPYGSSGTASGAGRRVDGAGWVGVARHVGAGWLAGARFCRGEFVPPARAA